MNTLIHIMIKRVAKNLISFLVLLFIITSSGCKKEEEKPISFETGTLTDIDNNIYRTVKIGNHWWMTENLKVKTFRDGNPVAQHQSDETWTDTTPAYCIYDNNQNSPGLLYNWYAVTSINNLAPEGWHIPSDQEWKELEQNLGMTTTEADKKGWRGTNEGDKLKIEGSTGWTVYPGVWATNESGFEALAGGCRLFNGTWGDPGLFATGFWWTSSEFNDKQQGWYRYLDYKNSNVFRSYCDKNYGFSIRCVKD
jgi:uncharacterized protein (TIGR02145 family)